MLLTPKFNFIPAFKYKTESIISKLDDWKSATDKEVYCEKSSFGIISANFVLLETSCHSGKLFVTFANVAPIGDSFISTTVNENIAVAV